jgi:DNA-binding winged helix-turn-helix (wHTH) protein
MCNPQKKPDRSLAWIQICRLQKEALRLDQIVELFQFQQSQLHVRLPVARRFLQLLLTYSPVQLIPFWRPTTSFSTKDLEINRVSHHVSRNGREIEVSPREYSLLEFLLRNPGRPVSRTAIIEEVWGMDGAAITNVVDVYINYLRRKLDAGTDHPLIRTVRGVGYQIGGNHQAAWVPQRGRCFLGYTLAWCAVSNIFQKTRSAYSKRNKASDVNSWSQEED